MKKQYDELLMQKLINEANSYLGKIEALLTSVDQRLAETSKKAA
ncbi:hypothetical protein BCV35_013570 [Vibrio cyclitrophicus]|nr:hypothetical protein [Vibrio cyclitrophicus]